MSVPNSVVVDDELEDSVHVRDLELGEKVTVGWFQRGANEGIQSNELELHVIVLEAHPFAVDHLLDFDRIDLKNHNQYPDLD